MFQGNPDGCLIISNSLFTFQVRRYLEYLVSRSKKKTSIIFDKNLQVWDILLSLDSCLYIAQPGTPHEQPCLKIPIITFSRFTSFLLHSFAPHDLGYKSILQPYVHPLFYQWISVSLWLFSLTCTLNLQPFVLFSIQSTSFVHPLVYFPILVLFSMVWSRILNLCINIWCQLFSFFPHVLYQICFTGVQTPLLGGNNNSNDKKDKVLQVTMSQPYVPSRLRGKWLRF